MGPVITLEAFLAGLREFLDNLDISGGAILYGTTGQNTDGAMTQKAVSDIIKLIEDNLAYAYNSEQTYEIGDLCIYGHKAYSCKTAIATPEAFDSAKWNETSVANIIEDLIDSVGTLSDLDTADKSSIVNAINELAAGGGGGGGGSTITVIAADAELYGGTVTVTDGSASVSGTLSDSGTVTMHVPMTGTLQVSVANGDYVGAATLSAPYYGSYSVTVEAADIYTLNISTSEATLYGQTVAVTNGTDVKTGTLSDSGTATIRITFTGSVTVSATDGEQTANSTVTVASGTDTYSVSLSFVKIYGAEWDGTSTTIWSRTDDAASFTDPVPYVAGATSYGSPFDALYPWSGMAKSERSGGTMVSIPKFWYKITQNGNGMKIQIADKQKDGFAVSPAHMDRGDGKGERDVIYVGRYHCASDYKSKTGTAPKANITRSTARSGIHGLGSNIWQMDFATRFTLWLLYIVEFAHWNSQVKIGYGCGNNSATQNMGYTDSMPYHTGTTLSSRTSYGLGTQYRYIEGLWDNVLDWLDGCYCNSSGLNLIKSPASFSDSSGGVAVGVPSSGYPSKFAVKDVSGTFPMFIPTEASGSDSTYSCDGWNFSTSGPCLFAGGGYDRSLGHGLFCVSYSSASDSGANLGCRLLELP